MLALPRGGVPVAAQAAMKLNAPLDIWRLRKVLSENLKSDIRNPCNSATESAAELGGVYGRGFSDEDVLGHVFGFEARRQSASGAGFPQTSEGLTWALMASLVYARLGLG